MNDRAGKQKACQTCISQRSQGERYKALALYAPMRAGNRQRSSRRDAHTATKLCNSTLAMPAKKLITIYDNSTPTNRANFFGLLFVNDSWHTASKTEAITPAQRVARCPAGPDRNISTQNQILKYPQPVRPNKTMWRLETTRNSQKRFRNGDKLPAQPAVGSRC